MAIETMTEPTKGKKVSKLAGLSPLARKVREARRCSTPLIGIETPDPTETIRALVPVVTEIFPGDLPDQPAIVRWDIVTGLVAMNKSAEALGFNPDATINPVEALKAIEKLPRGGTCYMMNAQRHIDDAGVAQAVWNLRDVFKLNRRTLILMGPVLRLPAEIAADVITFDEALPTREQLRAIVEKQVANADVPAPDADQMSAALDAIVGLPQFPAEQVTAMSLGKAGVNVPQLWERKCKAIEQTDGLRVYRGGERFSDLKGIDNVTAFMHQLVLARVFGTVVFIDEGEKVFAGGMADHVGDTGVSKDQVAAILSYIQDTGSMGVMLGGVPGTGKSALAKAVGNEAGVPTIQFDLGAMKQGTVGSSEAAIRAALKMLTATAEGRVLFLMTANNTAAFSPELNRRFPDQFFFDNPDAAGREALWSLYGTKNKLSADQLQRPREFARGWTGAEIRRACERAAMFKMPVTESARYLVPQCVSAAASLAKLREAAKGRFLSASYPGPYVGPVDEVDANAVGRAVTIDDED